MFVEIPGVSFVIEMLLTLAVAIGLLSLFFWMIICYGLDESGAIGAAHIGFIQADNGLD